MKNTFVLLKPESLGNSLAGKVMQALMDQGYQINDLNKVKVTKEKIEAHYAEHKGKPFFKGLTERFIDQEVYVMTLSGTGNVVMQVRGLLGATNPDDAEPDTIRGKFGWVKDDVIYNVIHASDSPEAVERETTIWIK